MAMLALLCVLYTKGVGVGGGGGDDDADESLWEPHAILAQKQAELHKQ